MNADAHRDELRSIIESAHCSGCTHPMCDFDDRVEEILDSIVEYIKEVDDNETIFVYNRTVSIGDDSGTGDANATGR